MADPQLVLGARVRAALGAAYGAGDADADPVIRPSSFADFQSNAALPLAKRLGRAPRDIAAEIVRQLDVDDVSEPPLVSGPGFINFKLRNDWIAAQATRVGTDPRLGVPVVADPQTVIVEYSSPNIAKEMHVGHLRTTIVGDAIARVLDFAGHNVIRDNHVGDWGTQFGMLIEYLVDIGEDAPEAQLLRTDPNTFYQSARAKFDSDPDFKERAQKRVVKLQSRDDPATLRLWDEMMELSRQYLNDVYAVLKVTLTDDDIRGESFYNDLLPGVIDDLTAKGLAVESDGALVVFPPGFTGRDGTPLPVIIRKRDGGFNYSTTDLATIRYRVDKINCDRAIYVVGSDQTLHFRMVFAVARLAGWLPEDAQYAHAQIGMVQGADGGRLRTGPATRSSSATCSTRASSRPARCWTRSRAWTTPPRTRSRRMSASARSSTPTCPRPGTALTPLTGTRCSPCGATPAPTCNTPPPGSGPSSAGPAWTRRRSWTRQRSCPPGRCRRPSW